MNLPLGILANRVLEYLQLRGVTDYKTNQTTHFINQIYQEIWDMANWPSAIAGPETLTIAASATYFILPKYMDWLLKVVNSATGVEVRIIDQLDFPNQFMWTRKNAVDSILGRNDIEAISPIGFYGVNSTAFDSGVSQFIVTSSSASDTYSAADGSNAVFVIGRNTSDEVIRETLQLNGTSNVTSTNSFKPPTVRFSKSSTTVGNITVKISSTTVATIATWETSPRYRYYKLSETAPTAGATLAATYKMAFVPLVNNTDAPVFDMDDAIVHGATARAFAESRKSELGVAHQNFYNTAVRILLQKEFGDDGAEPMLSRFTTAPPTMQQPQMAAGGVA